MTLRLPIDVSTRCLEAELGAEGMRELHELMIHALMPESLRSMVALTTPHLDAKLEKDVTQELRVAVGEMVELASKGIKVRMVLPEK